MQQFAATNRLIFATCFSTNFHCIDKDFHKHFASTHKALCHCDMSPQRVAANCLLVCSDLALLLLFLVFSMPDELFYHKHRSSCGVDGTLSFTVNLKFMSWTCYNLHASSNYKHISMWNSTFLKLHYTTQF